MLCICDKYLLCLVCIGFAYISYILQDTYNTDVADSNSKKGHFIASVNWFVSHFSGQVPLDCYIRLFQTYCSSHYGSVLWQLNGRGFSSFCISWNKGVRRVLGIPYKTHTALLGPIIDSCHVSIVLTSDNEIVKVIIKNAIVSAQSPIGMNIAILRNMYAIRVRNVNFCHVYKQAMHQPWSTVDVTPDSQFVKELLHVRNNESYLCDFTINEISALIKCVCVT